LKETFWGVKVVGEQRHVVTRGFFWSGALGGEFAMGEEEESESPRSWESAIIAIGEEEVSRLNVEELLWR
tara:strand:+ start:62 stop:271 length:210 start_codon:yes stop_codon:yes gene_type:complete